jgi:hypothetical protein
MPVLKVLRQTSVKHSNILNITAPSNPSGMEIWLHLILIIISIQQLIVTSEAIGLCVQAQCSA